MLMQASLNCAVKMFGNCKQTGHKGKTKVKVRLEVWTTQKYVTARNYGR